MTTHHLAQLNIGRILAPLDDASMAGFVNALAPINALADAAPGFVWRFQTAAGDATSLRPFDDDNLLLVNFSVWESVEALKAFVYQSDHAGVMRNRRQWFAKLAEQYTVLWWVPAGHIPTWEEAQVRLELLRRQGPTAEAFTFQQPFTLPAV
jgi:hypothetical protein